MVTWNPWLVVATGACGLICVLIAGAAGYWRYANQLPVYPAPTIVMPSPNAYDDYIAAAKMCQAAGGATVAAAPESPGALPPGGYGGPPGGPAAVGGGWQKLALEPDVPLEQVRAVVARNRPALARLRQGFCHEYRSPPVLSFNQATPELGHRQGLARVLVTEGKLAEREGRPNEAAHSYLDCLRLGTDVPRGGAMMHGLVGIAIQCMGLRPLQESADQLDGPTAAAAAREMARLDARVPSVAETLANEKEATTVDLLEMFRQPDTRRQLLAPYGDSLPPFFALRLSFTPKRQMLDNIRGYMDAVIAGSRRPYYARPAPPLNPNDLLSRLLLSLDFDKVRFKWALRDAQWRITEVRLAVRACEQQHGAPPPSLAALVPDYLPAVPQDPFARRPLVYRQTPTGALVYSCGPDGKDDGGKDLGSRVSPDSQGDIVTMKSLNQR
jgi:hypothetical protein